MLRIAALVALLLLAMSAGSSLKSPRVVEPHPVFSQSGLYTYFGTAKNGTILFTSQLWLDVHQQRLRDVQPADPSDYSGFDLQVLFYDWKTAMRTVLVHSQASDQFNCSSGTFDVKDNVNPFTTQAFQGAIFAGVTVWDGTIIANHWTNATFSASYPGGSDIYQDSFNGRTVAIHTPKWEYNTIHIEFQRTTDITNVDFQVPPGITCTDGYIAVE